MNAEAGFRESEHTADFALDAWAPDLPGLFEQAARGMYALEGVRLQPGERASHHLELRALDTESLLVSFLSELLYLGEQHGLGFDTFDIHLEGEDGLRAELGGAPIAHLDKEIKAVTYHNLAIRRTPRGLEVSLVFDV